MNNLILKGFGGPLFLTKGYGGGVAPTVDHRTLYAQAAARKPTGADEIDPKKTAAVRK